MTRLPWYPVLIPLVLVSSMYAAKPGAVTPDEFTRSAVAVVLVTGVLLSLTWTVYRDAHKAALFVSLSTVVFLSFDWLYAFVESWEVVGFRPMRRAIALPAVYGGLVACGWAIGRIRRPLDGVSALANVATASSLILPIASLAAAHGSAMLDPTPMLEPPRALRAAPAGKPDIYYVVFDRYGDEQTMRQYGLDNAPFYQYLEEKGFYIARESHSNYLKTVLSVASSLNMSYLDPLAAAQGKSSKNWWPVFDWVSSNRVTRFLKSHGYRYVHAGSWYWPTASSPLADRTINPYNTVPLAAMRLLDSDLITPLRRVAPTPLLDARVQQWHRVREQIDDIVAHAADPGPTFTFLHVLVPHSPYVFESDGRYVSADEESRRPRRVNYVNQVNAANLFAKRLVDGILARAPSPPVIILQGDEGPYPAGTGSDDRYNWRTATPQDLREKSGILNAYYLPAGRRSALYASISPVNSFRVVFNAYFGTQLEMLPDQVYGHESETHPYTFFDLTDAVNRAHRVPAVPSTDRLAAASP